MQKGEMAFLQVADPFVHDLVARTNICPVCTGENDKCECFIGRRDHYLEKCKSRIVTECIKRGLCLDVVDPSVNCMFCGNTIRQSQMTTHPCRISGRVS